MMEEVDAGTSFVKELRAMGNKAPIYMLSSVGDSLNMATDFTQLGRGRRLPEADRPRGPAVGPEGQAQVAQQSDGSSDMTFRRRAGFSMSAPVSLPALWNLALMPGGSFGTGSAVADSLHLQPAGELGRALDCLDTSPTEAGILADGMSRRRPWLRQSDRP